MAVMLACVDGATRRPSDAGVRSHVGVDATGSLFSRWLWAVLHGVTLHAANSTAASPPLSLDALCELSITESHVTASGGGGAAPLSKRAVVAVLRWLCSWVPRAPLPALRCVCVRCLCRASRSC